jgi:hypothetical protein
VFHSDTPAANFAGFRWSSDIDTNIKAVCQTSASNQTVVDTGVAPSSSTPQKLEIQSTTSGTVVFLINGAQVASIDSNVASVAMGSVVICDYINVDLGNTVMDWYSTFLQVPMQYPLS